MSAMLEPSLRIASYNVGIPNDDWAKQLPMKRERLQQDIKVLMKSCQVVLLQELGTHDIGLDSLKGIITTWIATVGTHTCYWGRCYLAVVQNEMTQAVTHKVCSIFAEAEDDPGDCIPGVPNRQQVGGAVWSQQCRIAQLVSLDFSTLTVQDPITKESRPCQPRRLHIFNLHIPAGGRHPSSMQVRKDTIQRLSTRLTDDGASVLIIGDLNLPAELLATSLDSKETWQREHGGPGIWAVSTRSRICRFQEPKVGQSNSGASDRHDALIIRWRSADVVPAAAAASSLPCNLLCQPSAAAKQAAALLVQVIQAGEEKQQAADNECERELQTIQAAELREVMSGIMSTDSSGFATAVAYPATTAASASTAIATVVAASAMAHDGADGAAACTDVPSPSQDEASSLSAPHRGLALAVDALQQKHVKEHEALIETLAADRRIPEQKEDVFSGIRHHLCLRVRAVRERKAGGPVVVWSQEDQEVVWAHILSLRELFLTRIVYHHPRCTFATLKDYDVISPAAAAEILHMLKNCVQTSAEFQEDLTSWEADHAGAPKMGHHRAQFKRRWFNSFVYQALGNPKMVQAVIMTTKWTENMTKALDSVRGKREQLWQQWQAEQAEQAKQAEQAEQADHWAQWAQQDQGQWQQCQSQGTDASGRGKWHSHQWQRHGWQGHCWTEQAAGAPLPGTEETRKLRRDRHKQRNDQRKAWQGSSETAPDSESESQDIGENTCDVCSSQGSTDNCWLCNRQLCQRCSIPRDVRCLEPSTCRALRCRTLRQAGADDLADLLEGGAPVPAEGVHGDLNRPALPKQTHKGPYFDGLCIEQLVQEWIYLETEAPEASEAPVSRRH
jgi:hypothetical protein